MGKVLIAQGAEAKIFLDEGKIVKERIRKNYRHPLLDEKLRKSRTRHEAKLLSKAKDIGANVPKVLNLNRKNLPLNPFVLEMEYIEGDKLSEKLNSYDIGEQLKLMEKLAEQISLLHANDIIHGDLTTSNTIWTNKMFIIDFGLGFFSSKIEDKAVDIHLLRQALEAKHYQNYKILFEGFLKNYKWGDSERVLEHLKVVEKRGRYKRH